VSISYTGAGTGLQINDNVMESNDISLNIGDNDSWQSSDTDVLLMGNTMQKSSAGATRPYTAIRVGDWDNTATDIRIIDTKYTNGATAGPPSFSDTSVPPQDIEMGWLLSLAVKHSGAAAAGASVQVLDSTGTVVYSGTTDASGNLSNIPVVTTTYTQLTSGGVTTTSSGTFQVVVTYGGQTVKQTINLTGDLSLNIQI
jgi:uncharacterized protein YfaS (alpha-2-macroglobulin family)